MREELANRKESADHSMLEEPIGRSDSRGKKKAGKSQGLSN